MAIQPFVGLLPERRAWHCGRCSFGFASGRSAVSVDVLCELRVEVNGIAIGGKITWYSQFHSTFITGESESQTTTCFGASKRSRESCLAQGE